MIQRILVTYATQHGSTQGIAEAIGETLARAHVDVDVRPMSEVRDVGVYTAVVAGSAIHGKWLPEAMRFLQENRTPLARVPTATFLVCMMLASPNDTYRRKVEDYMKPVRTLVTPVTEGLFAGAMWFRNYNLALAAGMRVFGAAVHVREGDHRDWDAIGGWANNVRQLLMP